MELHINYEALLDNSEYATPSGTDRYDSIRFEAGSDEAALKEVSRRMETDKWAFRYGQFHTNSVKLTELMHIKESKSSKLEVSVIKKIDLPEGIKRKWDYVKDYIIPKEEREEKERKELERLDGLADAGEYLMPF